MLRHLRWAGAILWNVRTRPARAPRRGREGGVALFRMDTTKLPTPPGPADRRPRRGASTGRTRATARGARPGWRRDRVAGAAGRLHRVHKGVYAVGHPVLPRNGAAHGRSARLRRRGGTQPPQRRRAMGLRTAAAFFEVTVPATAGPGESTSTRPARRPRPRPGIPVTTPGPHDHRPRRCADPPGPPAQDRRGRVPPARPHRAEPLPGRRGAGALARCSRSTRPAAPAPARSSRRCSSPCAKARPHPAQDERRKWAATRSTSCGAARG